MRFARIFSWPIRRLKVDDTVLPEFQKDFESVLSMKGILINIPQSDALLKRLVEEAYFRASRSEADGVPRYGALEDQVEDIAGKIEQVWSGNPEADPVVNRIMIQYGLKKER